MSHGCLLLLLLLLCHQQDLPQLTWTGLLSLWLLQDMSCSTIVLTGSEPYVLSDELLVMRPLTIVGSPGLPPLIDAQDAARAFRVMVRLKTQHILAHEGGMQPALTAVRAVDG